MIVIGGEPPFVEKPEPRFGDLISKLNEVAFVVQENTVGSKARIEEKILKLKTDVDDFVNEIVPAITAHIALTGPVHGETKKTIGLGDRDNYRVASTAEHIAYSGVNAFVVPSGVKASVEANNAEFVLENFQQNDLFQMASFFLQNDYSYKTLTRPDPTRYFQTGTDVGVLLNADRIVLSPKSDTAYYQGDILFTSFPSRIKGGSRNAELTNIDGTYKTRGWNVQGALNSKGEVSVFRPLSDKNIFSFKTNLALPSEYQNYLLYRGYASTLYKGLAVGGTVANKILTLHHKFFHVNNFDIDPTLVETIGTGYLGIFTSLGVGGVGARANGSHQINLDNYVTPPAGAVLAFTGEPVLSMFWDTQDVELFLHVVAPFTVTLNGVGKGYYLEFSERIVPGSLLPGGSARFTQVNKGAKDTILPSLLPSTTNWIREDNAEDLNNPLTNPGVFLSTGEVVKTVASKYGVRVKRQATSYKSLKEWTQAKRPFLDSKLSKTGLFTPSRHNPFTELPERVIPIVSNSGETSFLIYGLNTSKGFYEWTEHLWNSGSVLSTRSGSSFGVSKPSNKRNPNAGKMPKSLSINANLSTLGVGVSGLGFSPQSGHVGYDGFSYTNTVVNRTTEIKLSPGSIMSLTLQGDAFMTRAKAANPALNSVERELQIYVYRLTANRAIYILTDGLCYAEAGLSGFTITAGVFILDFTVTAGVKLSRVTPGGITGISGNRKSRSGDNPWSEHSDLLSIVPATNSFNICLTRAFGEIYGDISFSITNAQTATPVFTVGRTNKGQLYKGENFFDTVEELLPAILLPGLGIYQYLPTNGDRASALIEVGGVNYFSPFEVNETGWVRMPAGGRVLLGGRTYLLDEDFSIKTGAGTTYCYLSRQGEVLSAFGSSVKRAPSNSEVLFGTAVNGILTINKEYLILDNHLVSSTRQGSCIPAFRDNGGDGVNTFFKRADVID